MTSEIRDLSKACSASDSASLGSNPSPPATRKPNEIAVLSASNASDQTGQTGTDGTHRTHINRHIRSSARSRRHANIERLFCSSGSDRRSQPTDMMILKNCSDVGAVVVRPHLVPQELIDQLDRKMPSRLRTRSESAGHVWLKMIAEAWATKRWETEPIGEFWCCGSRIDVGIPDRMIAIECGNTNCGGCLAAMEDGWSYFLLPYSRAAQRQLDRRTSRRPHLFIFEFIYRPENIPAEAQS